MTVRPRGRTVKPPVDNRRHCPQNAHVSKPHRQLCAATAVLLAGVIACTSSKKADEGKKQASPVQLAEIAVELDGKPVAALTTKRLEALKPDFNAGDKRGWKVATIFGAALTDDKRLELLGANKVRVIHSRPAGARRGKALALIVGVGEPFIGRVDSETPFAEPARRRIDRLVKLKIYKPAASMAKKRTVKTEALEVRIELAGGKPIVWKYPQLKKVPQLAGQENHWSMRAIAAALAKGSRITEMETRKGKKYVVPAAEWKDAKRLPVVKLNRRGQLKFWWSSSDDPRKRGKMNLRDVTVIRLTTAPAK